MTWLWIALGCVGYLGMAGFTAWCLGRSGFSEYSPDWEGVSGIQRRKDNTLALLAAIWPLTVVLGGVAFLLAAEEVLALRGEAAKARAEKRKEADGGKP